ncbi:hypothetical protein ACRAWD_11710 [Caulobacter segnis]
MVILLLVAVMVMGERVMRELVFLGAAFAATPIRWRSYGAANMNGG